MDEETVRFFSALLRHYAIEGNTELFRDDPYILPHVTNPDFEDGLNGWTLEPATAPSAHRVGSIAAVRLQSLGRAEGRAYTSNPADWDVGDCALLTPRSAAAPNKFSQQLKALQPGRLYSLRFFTANYKDFVTGRGTPWPWPTEEGPHHYRHAVSVDIRGVEMVDEKSFQSLQGHHPGSTIGPFHYNNVFCVNYHQRVFRATDQTATLTFSDWKTAQDAGGLEGEELLWNFIEVKPYFEG